MNGLSWLLYAAEVVQSLGNLFAYAGAMLGIISGVSVTVYGVSLDDTIGDEKTAARLGTVLRWLLPITAVVAVLACLMPSSKTVYMIAASEMGQKVYETPAAQEVLTDLQVILKQKLGEMRKEGSK